MNGEPSAGRSKSGRPIGAFPSTRRICAIGTILVFALVSAGCRNSQAATPPALEPSPAASPGRAVTLMSSARHIDLGASHEPYNTDPPTSGPHYAEPAEAGFFTTAPPDEQLVHNLEHGYVVIWFRAEDLNPGERERLVADIQSAMQAAGNSPITNTPKLIAVPRPKLKPRLALTTWGRLDELDHFDERRILSFIEHFRDKAPEPTAR